MNQLLEIVRKKNANYHYHTDGSVYKEIDGKPTLLKGYHSSKHAALLRRIKETGIKARFCECQVCVIVVMGKDEFFQYDEKFNKLVVKIVAFLLKKYGVEYSFLAVGNCIRFLAKTGAISVDKKESL